MKRTHLLVIDPQNDFCDPKGSLYVKGADDDMRRLSSLIKKIGKNLYDIHCTLDSHHQLHIAHPMYWTNSKGATPNPFTSISSQDIGKGQWYTSLPSFQKIASDYLNQLEARGRYPHTIWPPHCLIGSPGYSIYPELLSVLLDWEKDNLACLNLVSKGSNIHREHFSAVMAEVVDPQDPSTQLNTDFINMVMEADEILVAGEALSHCLLWTVRDMADSFGDDSFIKKVVLLSDCTSPVPGFEAMGQKLQDDLVSRRMQVTTSKDYLK